jgi:hypothetical protein
MIAPNTLLTIPGWNGSGPTHWQSIWEARSTRFRRVEQRDWQQPSRREWIDAIDSAVANAAAPVILVAHSLGCIAVAHWAASRDVAAVASALLVAPPWLHDSALCPQELRSFLPAPNSRLPFPSILVASENDPYLPIDLASRLAQSWGSEFVNVGLQGHINVASGHGPWPAGERILERLCESAAAPSHTTA